MQTIYKYKIEPDNECTTQVPLGAKPLCVQQQGRGTCIWCEVDSEEKYRVPMQIEVIPTGGSIPAPDFTYLGTIQYPPIVAHIYTKIAPTEMTADGDRYCAKCEEFLGTICDPFGRKECGKRCFEKAEQN